MTEQERDAMVAVARAHVAAERIADIEATLATLDDDPLYELLPMGVTFHGRDAARRYYEHFFANCRPRIKASELRSEWITDRGVLQEYTLHVDEPDGTRTRHDLASVLSFGKVGRLSGERIYASDALIRFMFAPLLSSMKRSVGKGRERKAAAKRSDRNAQATGTKASRLIDRRIDELGDWRAGVLARVRALIHAADPEIVEEWKWMGTPVWSDHGIVCTGETYAKVVKLTFARGAALQDPDRLFNSSLEGNVRRAIDIHEGDKLPEAAFKRLVKAAVAKNSGLAKGR